MIGLQMPADRLEVMLVQDTSTESSCNVGLSLSALRDWKILLQGIVGEGYTRVLAGETHLLPNDGTFYGNPDDYELPHYFPSDSPATRKILLPGGSAYRRLLTPNHITADLTAAADSLAADALHTGRAGGLYVLPEVPAV